MMSAPQIFACYLRFYFLSIVSTVLLFSIAVEQVWQFPLFALAIGYGYWRKPQAFSRRHERMLALLLIVILLVSYVLSRGDLLLAAGYMLAGFCVIFFYQQSLAQTSYIQLLPLLGLMVISTFLTSELLYLLFFLLAMWFYSKLLFYLALQRLAQPSSPVLSSTTPSRYPARAIRIGGKLSAYLAGAVIIVLAFLLLPRTSWEINISRNASSSDTARFNKEVEEQTITRLMKNNFIYFRVKTSQRDPYFQGAVCNVYTGHKWESQFATSSMGMTIHEGKQRFVFDHVRSKAALDIFTIEDYQGTPVIFRGKPQRLQFDPWWKLGNTLRIDAAGNIETAEPMRRGIEYLLWYTPTDIRRAKEPHLTETGKRHYLQVPELSQRVRDLAQTCKRNTPQETVTAVVAHLQQYPYTLNMNPGDNEWVDYFLFEARQGYCVHFATAMAVLLRLNAIPTRLVCGFLGKNYEVDRRQFVISNEDAHAWLEVHIPGRGWMSYDPTPPQEDYLKGMQLFQHLYYKLRSWWFKEVIGFSRLQQRAIYNWIRDAARQAWRYAGYWLPPLVALWLWRRIRQWRRDEISAPRLLRKYLRLADKKGAGGTAHAASYLFYRQMADCLRRLDIERAASETPHEFARRVKLCLPAAQTQVDDITDFFYQLRFGHHSESAYRATIAQRLQELEATVARCREQQLLAKKEA